MRSNDLFWDGIFAGNEDRLSYIDADIRDYYGQLTELSGLGARKFLTILAPRKSPHTNVLPCH